MSNVVPYEEFAQRLLTKLFGHFPTIQERTIFYISQAKLHVRNEDILANEKLKEQDCPK